MLEHAYVRHVRVGHGNQLIPNNQNTYAAADGFVQQGLPISSFTSRDDLEQIYREEQRPAEAIVSGNIGDVHLALRLAGIGVPAPLDYPDHLKPFLGREIEKKTLGWVRALGEGKVFIKPAAQTKQFTGCIWDPEDPRPRLSLATLPDDTEIWVSTVIEQIWAEWRVFVKRDKIIGVKHYAGDWDHVPYRAHSKIVETISMCKGKMPIAYALDFGCASGPGRGGMRLFLIEANDGYALGCYGLPSIIYARFLEARWCELHGVASNA